MKAVFEKDYDLRPSDFDCNGKLLPSAILDIFQDAAGRHSVIMGADIKSLDKKGLIWVVAKIRFEVVGNAEMYQTVKVKTWPLKPTRVIFRRECVIYAENGEEIVRGSTEWVVVDKEKRKIASGEGVYSLNESDYLSTLVFNDKIGKIPSFAAQDEGFKICPRFSDIDINGHVNNTKYANYVIDALAESEKSFNFGYFQIDYHKEVLKGSNLKVYITSTENEILAVGKCEDDIMFSCRIG